MNSDKCFTIMLLPNSRYRIFPSPQKDPSCFFPVNYSQPPTAAAAAAKSLQSCLDSVRPHGQQPTRLLCPRASPGKNTGVGCHFLLQGLSQYILKQK